MAERTTTGRLRFRKGVAFATVLLAVLGAASGGGHQFFHYSPDWDLLFHPKYQRPIAWDPTVWPRGATLSVAVAESELWGIHFGSYDDLRRTMERSLSLWADIESADIRWKVEIIAPYGELWKYPIVVFLDENSRSPGYAEAWFTRNSAGQFSSTRRCQIGLYPSAVPYGEALVGRTAHELGHCLGLAHSDGSPFSSRGKGGFGFEFPEPIWGWKGVMQRSGAFSLGRPRLPSLDERVAASLLRPRAGWLQETGSIWGAVVVGREPARAVYVLASPVDPETGRIGPGVGAYTHGHGTFGIRGLNPGTYALWVFDSDGARSPSGWGAESFMDVEDHIHDTIWKMPVVVRAGERTGPVMISVRRAAQGR